MPKNLIPDIEWQSLIWSDVKRPVDKRQNAESAFSNFPTGNLDFIQSPQVWEFIGTQKFYRFADPTAILKYNDPGAWWVEESTYLQCDQNARKISVSFPDYFRAAFAVSKDWSELKQLYEIIVPVNQKILGVLGETKYQPEYSDKSTNKSNLVFFGRGKQVYFRGEDISKFSYSLFRTF